MSQNNFVWVLVYYGWLSRVGHTTESSVMSGTQWVVDVDWTESEMQWWKSLGQIPASFGKMNNLN